MSQHVCSVGSEEASDVHLSLGVTQKATHAIVSEKDEWPEGTSMMILFL